MKKVYPVVLTPIKEGYGVYVPALDINTHGKDLVNAVEMARDAICLTIWSLQDDLKQNVPEPDLNVRVVGPDVLALVDVDIEAYKRAHEQRTIRRNCSIPSWLNEKAEAAGINVSRVLQEALEERLGTHS
jgi:predicted RNase H-like HicB family nuclease